MGPKAGTCVEKRRGTDQPRQSHLSRTNWVVKSLVRVSYQEEDLVPKSLKSLVLRGPTNKCASKDPGWGL